MSGDSETNIKLIQKDVQYIREKIDGIVETVADHGSRIRDIEIKMANMSGQQVGAHGQILITDRKFKLALTALILATSAVNIIIAIFH